MGNECGECVWGVSVGNECGERVWGVYVVDVWGVCVVHVCVGVCVQVSPCEEYKCVVDVWMCGSVWEHVWWMCGSVCGGCV